VTSPSEGQEEPALRSEWWFEEVTYEEKAAWVSILEQLNSTWQRLLHE